MTFITGYHAGQESVMVRAFREHVVVQPGGKVEVSNPALPEGSRAEVIIVLEDGPGPAPKRKMADFFGSCPGMFGSAEEIDTYIRELRDEWDEP